uniref:Uncharacterized protein n=1 Tax=Timema tahoe TaxID=61484 RepID=A0A7R9NUZ1_9NEOP|nr:unnamed protein product [Timema tahoe]
MFVFLYPVYLSELDTNEEEEDAGEEGSVTSIQRQFTGLSSMDEICCSLGISNQHLENQVEGDPSVLVIWK